MTKLAYGEKKYIALVGEIVRVTVVAEGTGHHVLHRNPHVRNPYVVRADRGTRSGLAENDEFVVPQALIFDSPIEANIEAQKILRELGEDDDFDDDEEDADDEGADDEDD